MAQYSERECSKHGLQIHRRRLNRKDSWVCKICAKDFDRFRNRRQKIKLINYFGGKCIVCGYNKSTFSLCFHHKDPNIKCFGLAGKSMKYSLKLEEAKKCDLLCLNCHGELHERL